MKGMYRVALMMGLAAATAAPADAAVTSGPGDGSHEIRVVNNFMSPVRVYALDAEGHLHHLGRVARGKFKVLEVSAEIARMGDLQIKVYPNEPAWSLSGNANGIKTRELDLDEGDAVTVWLETDLTRSMIQVDRG